MTEAAGTDAAVAVKPPAWARMSAARREHALRVAGLMEAWANRLDLPGGERARWALAALYHDALKDAPAGELRELLSGEDARLPEKLLHGPAAAARMEAEAVGDAEVREAVRYHTIGHPALRRLGQALYLADWMEPGRGDREGIRAGLRARMPDDWGRVLEEVARRRIHGVLARGRALRPETMAFWNERIAEEGP